MACKICERIKNMRLVDVILIVLICVGMYIANHFQMQSYYKERAQKTKQNDKQRLKEFEELQKKCYFKQDKAACKKLKQF